VGNVEKLRDLQEQWIKETKEAGLETASSIMEKMRTLVQMAIEREQQIKYGGPCIKI